MNEEEFRNDASEKDKFAAFLTVEEVQMTKVFKTQTREETEEYIESIRQCCFSIYKQYCNLNNSSDNLKKGAA